MSPPQIPADRGPRNLIALHRTPPAQKRPSQWLDELLAQPAAKALVQAMPEQEVFLAVRELGLADSLDLLRLCSSEQLRACLDIDCWQRDQLDRPRFLSWLAALMELGPQRLGRVIEALDHELLVTFLQHEVRVYEVNEEEDLPEEPEGHFYRTPDRFYVIDLLGESGPLIERLFEMLYAADLDLGRRVVMGARWDIGAETEETAYRFRSARMADLGYLDYYEALPIYATLDLHTVRLGERSAAPLPEGGAPGTGLIPTELDGALGDSSFGHALRSLDSAQRDALLRQLLVLINQVLSADRVDPADQLGARKVMLRAAGYLSLAVEYLARPTGPDAQLLATAEGRAALALRSVSITRLFRLGYSLTVQLGRIGTALRERGLATLAPNHDSASLLEPPLDEVLRLLALPRPLFSSQLVGGPCGGRPFQTLTDIGQTAAALEEAKALGEFLTTGLGIRRDTLIETLADKCPPISEVRLSDLLGTLAANLLLSRPPALVPLSRADLPALRQAALGLHEASAGLSAAARRTIRETLRQRVAERSVGTEADALWPPAPSAVDRFVDHTLDRLGTALAALPPDLSPAQADALPSLPGLVLD